MKGFYSEASPQLLFVYLWEVLAVNWGVHGDNSPDVDDTFYKMSFTLTRPDQSDKSDSDKDSDGDETDNEFQNLEIVTNVRVVNAEPGPNFKVFLSFRRKCGDPILFGTFLRDMLNDKLLMFMDPSPYAIE